MFGLEVTLRGEPSLLLALDQKSYMVSAGASWRRKQPGGKAELSFQASGIDDQDDALLWLKPTLPAPRSWLDIAVIDTAVAARPRVTPRKNIDWDRHFSDLRAHDQKQIVRLEALLKRLESGRAPRPREWAVSAPQVAFRVLLNGKEVCKAAVGDPGLLTVTVYARCRDAKNSAQLRIHGADQTGPESFQGYEWKAKNRLSIGDRVRIALVAPKRLSKPEPTRPELPPTRETLQRKLDELREQTANANYYTENARVTRDYQEQRPPPRRYSR